MLVSEADPSFLLHAMRAGIRDILSPNADAAEIRVLLERACQSFATRHRNHDAPPAENAAKGLVIGVFSPKGGVGKTTLATNIAIGLGQIAPMSVVIVDLDLQFGDVASGLYLNPEHTVTDAVSPAAAQDSLVLKAFLTVHPAGIYALCAPPNPVDADHITPEQVTRLLEQLAQEFQYVVVDTAPGLPEIGLAAMEQCTDVVWVSAMDIPSLRGLRSGLEVLRQLEILPESRHVVLNMADSKAGLTVQDVESTVGAPVDVSIPRSRAVALSTNRGIPVLQESREGPGREKPQAAGRAIQPGVARPGPAQASPKGGHLMKLSERIQRRPGPRTRPPARPSRCTLPSGPTPDAVSAPHAAGAARGGSNRPEPSLPPSYLARRRAPASTAALQAKPKPRTRGRLRRHEAAGGHRPV